MEMQGDWKNWQRMSMDIRASHVNTAPADPVPLVNPSEDSMMNNWIPATTRAVMIEPKIAWIMRVEEKGNLGRLSTLWT